MIGLYLKPQKRLVNLLHLEECKVIENPSALPPKRFEVRAYWASGRNSSVIRAFASQTEAETLLESISEQTAAIVPTLQLVKGRVQWKLG